MGHGEPYLKNKRVSRNFQKSQKSKVKMKNIFYTLFFLSFANVLLSQVGLQVQTLAMEKESQLNWGNKNENLKVFFTENKPSQIPEDLKKYFLAKNVPTSTSNIFIKKNANQELAFFCRIEEKIELKSSIPVRFRLGEVQAVDQKEGKWQQFNN